MGNNENPMPLPDKSTGKSPNIPDTLRIGGQTVKIHRVPKDAVYYVVRIELSVRGTFDKMVTMCSETLYSPEQAAAVARSLASLSATGCAAVMTNGGRMVAEVNVSGPGCGPCHKHSVVVHDDTHGVLCAALFVACAA